MKILCECNSFNCTAFIEAPLLELNKDHVEGNVLIAKDCSCGPNVTDEFVVNRQEYTIYKEANC